MRKTTQLRKLIEDPELLVMPGAYDAFSAMLVEQAGFRAVQCSGLGLAASLLGRPDVSIISMREMVQQTYHIAHSVDIPVMGDGDTGFGNAVNVYFTVQEFERAGAAGMNLEDQAMPKRCGHMDGKQVISIEEMLLKIEAAMDAKTDPDFVINARTDALAVYGVEEAIRRGNAYAEAGATLIFVDGIESGEQVRQVVAGIDAPLSINMLEGGKTPLFTFAELQEMGAARVSCPLTAFLAMMHGVETVLGLLAKNGGPLGYEDQIAKFEDYKSLIGMPRIRTMEEKYLTSDVLHEKYDRPHREGRSPELESGEAS